MFFLLHIVCGLFQHIQHYFFFFFIYFCLLRLLWYHLISHILYVRCFVGVLHAKKKKKIKRPENETKTIQTTWEYRSNKHFVFIHAIQSFNTGKSFTLISLFHITDPKSMPNRKSKKVHRLFDVQKKKKTN